MDDQTDGTTSRRRVLKQSAVLGSIVWSAPVVRSYRTLATPGTPPPTSSTPTTMAPVPMAFAVSICTPQEPFAVRGSVTGFPPNRHCGIFATFHFDDGSEQTGGTVFDTDGDGAADTGSIQATRPFVADVVFFLELNNNLVQDPGEPTILEGTVTIDTPCQGAPLIPI